MENILTSTKLKNFFASLAKLDTEQDVADFMRDIATISELSAMAERLEVARLLSEGASYRTISEQTGASTTTVTRVAHWLHHGMGGYQNVLERMKQ